MKLDNIMLCLAPPEAGSGPQGRERAVLRDPETGRLVVKVSVDGSGLVGGELNCMYRCSTTPIETDQPKQLADFGLAMLLGGDPCNEHSGSGSYYCLGGGGGASGGNNNNNEMDDGVAMMGGNEAAAAGGRRWGQQGQGDGGGGNGQTEQLRQSLVGKDSPPTSPGGQRERRFPAVGTMAYMAPEVEHDSRFGVQVSAWVG